MGEPSPAARLAVLEAENLRLSAEVRSLRAQLHAGNEILDSLPEMVFVKTADELRFVRVNRTGAAWIGHTEAELLGHSDADFFPPDEVAFYHQKDREVLESGRTVDIPEEPLHTPTGLRWLHTRKTPIVDAQGRPRYLLGVSTDITDAVRAREALVRTTAELHAGEDALRALVTVFPGLVWRIDGQLRLVFVDGAAAAALGLGTAQLGRGPEDLPGDPATLVALHRQALGGGHPAWSFTQNGRTYEARLEPVGADGDGALGVALDVTERHRAEEADRRAELERVQKMELLGLLAGGIAHDFNNLLAAILGNTSLALARMPLDTPGRGPVERAERAAEAARGLTAQLLAYSGRTRIDTERTNLSTLVEGIAGLVRVSIPRTVSLTFTLDRQVDPVVVDVGQLRQVVLNLLTNAADAVGDGAGTIRIATGVLEADAAYLASCWVDDKLPPGRYAWLEVSDNGVGMDEATLNRIFDPFFTTKPKGHGLGLAAAIGIVRRHRGTMRVETAPGRGTTIRVLLPAVAGPPVAPAVVDAGPRAGVRRGRVLVVDDEESIRIFLRDALMSFGYEVATSADGVEALERVSAPESGFDLIILDMTMPRLSGEETFRALRALRPTLPILMTSGYTETEAAAHFAGDEHAGFLQKPYRMTEILDRLDALLAPA